MWGGSIAESLGCRPFGCPGFILLAKCPSLITVTPGHWYASSLLTCIALGVWWRSLLSSACADRQCELCFWLDITPWTLLGDPDPARLYPSCRLLCQSTCPVVSLCSEMAAPVLFLLLGHCPLLLLVQPTQQSFAFTVKVRSGLFPVQYLTVHTVPTHWF